MSQTTTSSANSASPLLQLPPELLVRVASYLTTPGLGHLRGVCKDVESRLFESFAYEFFHKRQFMIEEPSLQALIDISNHPTLSKRLTEVIISTTSYGEAENLLSMTAQKLFLGGFANQEVLISSGQARDMLVEAFKNLPNLRRIGLRDYDAKGRYRDGDKASWRSYGHSIMESEVAQSNPPDQAWLLLLHSIGLSGAQIPTVEVFLRDQYLTEKSFGVLSGRMSRTVAPVLAQLRTLMLTLSADRALGHNSAALQSSAVRLKKFLHHAPVLERLRLNFDEGPSSLLDWLALSPTGPTVGSPTRAALNYHIGPIPLAHLTTLDLGMVCVNPATLLMVLTRFELKIFNLWRITLEVENRSEIKKADVSNPATKFIDNLAKADATHQVQRAMLGLIKINGKSQPRHRAYDVDFPPVGSGPDSTSGGKDGGGNGRKPGHSGRQDLTAKHRTINFSLGGSAPNFGVWAKQMAARATVKTLRFGVGVSSDTSDHDGDSEDSELDDMEDEDEDEEDE